MTDAKKADKPFFLWWNSTRMHIWMRLKKERKARPASASILTAWQRAKGKVESTQRAAPVLWHLRLFGQ